MSTEHEKPALRNPRDVPSIYQPELDIDEKTRLYTEAWGAAELGMAKFPVRSSLQQAESTAVIAKAYADHGMTLPELIYPQEVSNRKKWVLPAAVMTAVLTVSGVTIGLRTSSDATDGVRIGNSAAAYEERACEVLEPTHFGSNQQIDITSDTGSPIVVHGANSDVVVPEGVKLPEIYLCGPNSTLVIEGYAENAGVFGRNASLVVEGASEVAVVSGDNAAIWNDGDIERTYVAGQNSGIND